MGFVNLMVLNSLYKNQHIHVGLKRSLVEKKNKKDTKLIQYILFCKPIKYKYFIIA